jgi:competence protein ComFB
LSTGSEIMDIHNTMEDIVLHYLEEILILKNDICKCEQCKTDMACYVLNKVKPMYVVSSRGIIHAENFKRNYIQEEIDIYSIVAQAVEVVSNKRRHEVEEKLKNEQNDFSNDELKYFSDSGNFYNFPQIVGRLFDSLTIRPIDDAQITLLKENDKDNVVPMFNKCWFNPAIIVPQMNGTYTFWPAPIPAEKADIQKDFYMNVEIVKEGYDKLCKYFFIRLISSNYLKKHIKKENIYYIDDLFITPKET